MLIRTSKGSGTSYICPLQIGFNSRRPLLLQINVSYSMCITYIYLSYSSINPSHKKKFMPCFHYSVTESYIFTVFFNSFLLPFFLSPPFSFFHSILHPSPPSFLIHPFVHFFLLSFILCVKVIYPILPLPCLILSNL